MEINRFCKWGTAEKQLIQLQMVPGAALQQSPFVLSSAQVFTIGFDVNTVPQADILTKKQSNSLLIELVQESSQLMSKGYAQLT
jgi:hypothetical protein